MSSPRYNQGDPRRQVGSPRPKGGRETRDTPCRNIMIYGKCRFENQGCAFKHDQGSRDQSPELSSRRLTGEAPSFFPNQTFPNQRAGGSFTPQSAANAQSFQPRRSAHPTENSGSSSLAPSLSSPASGAGSSAYGHSSDIQSATFSQQQMQDFNTSPYLNVSLSAPDMSPLHQQSHSGGMGINAEPSSHLSPDPFSMSNMQSQLAAMQGFGSTFGGDQQQLLGTAFDASHTRTYLPTPQQPPLYHLYGPIGPEPSFKSRGNQKTREAFVNSEIREEFLKKQAASTQVLPPTGLPQIVNHFAALVPLDTTNHGKSTRSFNYNSWVYKAFNTLNGRPYFLRRIENVQLSNQNVIRRAVEWTKIWSGNIVHVEDAFTTKAFNDSSLIFVQDYHALAKTLSDIHCTGRNTPRTSEATLWSYLSQLANALNTIHSSNLAARCIEPSKVILTHRNRIRLSGCGILDVVAFDNKPVHEQQQEDLVKVGRLMLSIMLGNDAFSNPKVALESGPRQNAIDNARRIYKGAQIVDIVEWLITPVPHVITELAERISKRMFEEFDNQLLQEDRIRYELNKTIEADRIARLTIKLNVLLDRPEYKDTIMYPETESRYILRLFRDYVFFQVDANGKRTFDLGHMMECLLRMDCGSDELICLTSSDEKNVIVISYQEIKRHLGIALQELGGPTSGVQS